MSIVYGHQDRNPALLLLLMLLLLLPLLPLLLLQSSSHKGRTTHDTMSVWCQFYTARTEPLSAAPVR